MSNFDKAVEIIGELATEYGQPGGDELFGLDEDAALALNTAGLLAPDLPEPDVIRPGNRTKYWFDENIYAHEGSGRVRVIADDARFTVDEAREHALSVLAACEYAEKEQDNG